MSSSVIMRTIITLPDGQVEQLAALCRREGISRAEAVRRAVARYLEERRLRPRDDAFGIWRDREPDGLAYERRLRAEWS